MFFNFNSSWSFLNHNLSDCGFFNNPKSRSERALVPLSNLKSISDKYIHSSTDSGTDFVPTDNTFLALTKSPDSSKI